MFEWDEANLNHIGRHRVTPGEAEQALQDPRRISATAHRGHAERRRAVIGATEAGRLLFVVTVNKGHDIRVVTARDAADSEQRRYRLRGR